MATDLDKLAQEVAASLWEDVDWFEDQQKAEASKPSAVGVPLSLIGEATDRMAQKIAVALRRVQRGT